VLSKPSISILDQSSKIINWIGGYDFVVRDDQTYQMKFSSSQKMVSYGLDFLSLKKFFLDCEILHEYTFVEIEFQIFEASYFVDKLMTMLHSKYIFLLHNRV
jgi:hypothetical protein